MMLIIKHIWRIVENVDQEIRNLLKRNEDQGRTYVNIEALH